MPNVYLAKSVTWHKFIPFKRYDHYGVLERTFIMNGRLQAIYNKFAFLSKGKKKERKRKKKLRESLSRYFVRKKEKLCYLNKFRFVREYANSLPVFDFSVFSEAIKFKELNEFSDINTYHRHLRECVRERDTIFVPDGFVREENFPSRDTCLLTHF